MLHKSTVTFQVFGNAILVKHQLYNGVCLTCHFKYFFTFLLLKLKRIKEQEHCLSCQTWPLNIRHLKKDQHVTWVNTENRCWQTHSACCPTLTSAQYSASISENKLKLFNSVREKRKSDLCKFLFVPDYYNLKCADFLIERLRVSDLLYLISGFMDHTRNMVNTVGLIHLTKDEQISFKGKHWGKEDISTFAECYPGTYSSIWLKNAQYLMAM